MADQPSTWKFLVVEDHVLVSEGLVTVLKTLTPDGGTAEVKQAATSDEALALLEADANFDLILLDLMLPGTGGIGLLGALRKRHPAVPVLVLSAMDDAATVSRVMRQGAAGFVPKSSCTQVLLDAVRKVLAGGTCQPAAAVTVGGTDGNGTRAPARRGAKTLQGLSAAQTRVLELLAEGKTNRQIGEVIGVTEGTVKIHASAIFRVLKVENRAQAMLVAQRYGIKAGH